MQKREISATLSEQALTFRPGGATVSFDVTVINESDRFASFQLELIAPGADRNLVDRWYTLSPEVSAKKPPGDQTQFKVVIADAPILGFVGTMNLTVRIFSSELRDERKYLLRLMIEQGGGPTLLQAELPVRQFQTYPSNTVKIPVRVRNLSQQSADVVLRFLGIDASWLMGGTERRLRVDPGAQVEVAFDCQPPTVTQAPSQEYPFTIEATPQDGMKARVDGGLEVLPIGFVQFSATPQKQRIPAKGSWLPGIKADPATYELLFKNASNVVQQVHVKVQIQGDDQSRCSSKIIPEEANLNLGETTQVLLEAHKPRPWVGFPQTLRLEAAASLSDQRLGGADPATQSLELQVFPILPLWLQAALIAFLAALIAFWPRSSPEGHTDFVNSVRFSGDVLSVLSGSDDRTIRRWTVEGNSLKPKGILATTDKSVRVLRFVPENNDQAAAGLENGVIQLWNVPLAQKAREFTYRQGDRVFDLVFSKDSRFLFSGHGSGLILWWDRTVPGNKPKQIFKLDKDLDYNVQALALSPDERTLVSAGRFNRLVLWNLTKPEARPRRITVPGGQNDLIWSAAFAAKLPDLLATSDSRGYITLWDLSQCKTSKSANSSLTLSQDVPIDVDCAVRDQWQGHGPTSVRSIALSPDGRLLVSAGDDGRVVLWTLTAQGKRDSKAITGKEIDRHSAKVNSVDIARDTQGTLVVSSGDDRQVTLRRVAGSP
jgi:WD40 repeat protein